MIIPSFIIFFYILFNICDLHLHKMLHNLLIHNFMLGYLEATAILFALHKKKMMISG